MTWKGCPPFSTAGISHLPVIFKNLTARHWRTGGKKTAPQPKNAPKKKVVGGIILDRLVVCWRTDQFIFSFQHAFVFWRTPGNAEKKMLKILWDVEETWIYDHLKVFYQVPGNTGKEATVIQQLFQLEQHAAILLFIHSDQFYESLKSVCGLPLQHCLPLPQSLSDGKAGNHAMDLGSPLAHVILNVEDKRLLAEVSVYDLTWCLQTHSGVQIWLEDTAGQAHKFSKISVF